MRTTYLFTTLALVGLLLGCTATDTPDATNDTETPLETEAAMDTFYFDEELGTYYGSIVLDGYASLEERQEAWCEENCGTYTYVSFNALEASDETFDEYIEMSLGNAFVGEASVVLGCLEGDVITRSNHSNELGMVESTLDENLTRMLLDSRAEKPVKIELERLPLTHGRGAPDCYSHFTYVREVK